MLSNNRTTERRGRLIPALFQRLDFKFVHDILLGTNDRMTTNVNAREIRRKDYSVE